LANFIYLKPLIALRGSCIMALASKVCVVTGSNSGIGKETALALAEMGATVAMVVRNQEKGQNALDEIVAKTGNHSVSLMLCDMSSMASIRGFAAEFKKKYTSLNVLVNNAGAEFIKRQVTSEGFEQTFAVNYLAPFLLTHELLDLLKAGAPSRIINVSSGLAKNGKVDFDDLQNERNYKGMQAYSNAKLMLMMFTYALSRRLAGSGVTANVLTPGFVATNLGKNSGSRSSALMFTLVRPMQISAKKGAETPVYLASSNEVSDISGKCFAKKKETATCTASYDIDSQERLWVETAKLLKLDWK
jgi:NAD(P)-dependent dehydrogenase (short-subunit alcohol dehydrogenase family)